jgi:hypothetical protein
MRGFESFVQCRDHPVNFVSALKTWKYVAHFTYFKLHFVFNRVFVFFFCIFDMWVAHCRWDTASVITWACLVWSIHG